MSSQPSALSQTLGDKFSQAAESVQASSQPQAPAPQPTPAPQPPSHLTSTLAAIVSAAQTGLASVPSHGRPSFFNGLTEGARGAQAAEANQQQIKFKDFDNQVRAANLHNQDIELHMRQEAQADTHQQAQDAQHDWDEAHGIQYDVVPNTSSAVTDHLTAQTSANGAASIPPGTHLSADGKSILIPKQTTDTQAGQLQKYNTFGPAYGLPSLPQDAQFVPAKYVDMLQHKLGGYNINGEPINHDDLPGAIASLQTQRDAIANSANTNPAVLKQLDSTIGIYKSNLKALDTHADDFFAKQTAQKAAQAKAVSDATLSNKEALQDNAASNKPQKAASDEWRTGATTMQKNKADLAENMVLNANSVASILIRRPDIVGAVAGRFTNAQQMMGNNDRDIAALGTAIHNIAMANNGIHGMKSNEGVKEFEALTLNHFKNGPMAVAGALGESTKSVQSFIDAARPDTYKTHSKNGGAIKAMVSQ